MPTRCSVAARRQSRPSFPGILEEMVAAGAQVIDFNEVIDVPRQIAADSDLAYPECDAAKPIGAPLMNRYMKRVLLAAQVSSDVNTALLLVQNLTAAPSTLMRPAMVRKVLRGAREAELRQQIRAGVHRRASVEVFS
jgi:hypothetical protein